MKKKLTIRELALVKHLAAGASLTEAAIKAGYSPKRPDQSGYQAFQIVKSKMPEILEKHGLTDDSLIEKYLVPLMNAHETKFFQHEGRVVDERNVISWGPRRDGLDMAFRLRGSYAEKESGVSPSSVGVQIITNVNLTHVQ